MKVCQTGCLGTAVKSFSSDSATTQEASARLVRLVCSRWRTAPAGAEHYVIQAGLMLNLGELWCPIWGMFRLGKHTFNVFDWGRVPHHIIQETNLFFQFLKVLDALGSKHHYIVFVCLFHFMRAGHPLHSPQN